MKALTKVMLSVIIAFTVTTSHAQTKLTFSTAKIATVEVYEEFIKQAYQQIGIEVKTVLLPLKRALADSNSGKTDGEVLRIGGITKQFPNLIMVPVKITAVRAAVYSKNKDLKVNGMKSIKSLKIGVLRGLSLTDALTKGMKPHVVNSIPSLFGILKKDRIDAVLMIRSFGDAFLKSTSGFEMIHPIEPAIMEVPMFHYLHKKNQHLIPKITPVLQKMLDNNTLDSIRKKVLKSN